MRLPQSREIAGGYQIGFRAADVLDQHLPYVDGGLQAHLRDLVHHPEHLPLGDRGVGLDRAAGIGRARHAHGGGDYPGGPGQLRFAVLLPPLAAVAADGLAVLLVHQQMAAPGADDTDQFLHAVTSSIDTVIWPTAFSSSALGRTMCSISPGAMWSRL